MAGRGAGTVARLNENEAASPSSGERFVFTTTTQASKGEVLGFDFFVAPRGGVPMRHYHAGQSEVFRCKRGELTMTIGKETRKLRPGEEVMLARGTLHSLVNEGDEEVHCEVEYRPAGKNEDWFRLLGSYALRHGRDPGMLEIAPFILDVDIVIEGPPRWLQRLLFGLVLRPIAIVLGRRRAMLDAAEEVYGRPFVW